MNPPPSLEARLHRLGVRCFAAIAVAGGVVLVGRPLGQAQTGVFDLASSALVLLFGFSLAAWLCHREFNRPVLRWIGVGIGLAAMVVNGLICARFLWQYEWPGEEWLAQQLTARGTQPVRVLMSETAAFSLLLINLACLAQCRSCFRRQPWRQAGALLALVVALLGLVMLLCYLLQSSYYAPMAFLVSASSLLMGLGLLMTAGVDNWPLNLFLVHTEAARSGRQFAWGLFSVALLLAVTVGATGHFYFKSQQANGRQSAWVALAAVADLKAAQINAWRIERLADATYLRHTPYPARRTLDYLQQPDEASTEEILRAWLDSMLAKGQAYSAMVLDEHLRVRLVHPPNANSNLSGEVRRAAQQALESRRVAVADLHRTDAQSPVMLCFAVPCVTRREGDREMVPAAGQPDSPDEHGKAVIVLQINAETTLFGMVQGWPTPSPSAKALLVQQEGDEIVLLTPTRRDPNAALNLRIPLSHRCVEVRSALQQGKMDGRLNGDDHGLVPVLAIWRHIPDTPWYLIAKVDQEEIFAPLRRQAWTTAGLVGALIGIALLGTSLLGRQRHLVLIQRELLAERQRREAEQKFHTLFETSRDAIMLMEDNRFSDCNRAALDLFGCATRDQFLGRHPADFSPPRQPDGTDSRTAATARIETARTQGGQFFEWLHQRPDGTVFPAEVLLSRIELGGKTIIQGVVRDISERKRAEAALLEISDREQARIGQDLHDGLCQHLVVTAFAANSLKEKLAERAAPELADAGQIAGLLDDAITQARNTARGLYPVRLEYEGLAAALQGLAANIIERMGVACELDYPVPVLIPDNATATQLYRIAQEAVTNSLKHAQPSKITLRLVQQNGQIELTVRDDGIGINNSRHSLRGMGLTIMEHRARTLGGALKIRRRKRGGTLVSCVIFSKTPVSAAATD